MTTSRTQRDDRRFGLHLVRRGLITEDQLYEALNQQASETPPIGKIALHSHVLTMKEVMTILESQLEKPRLFGELAIDLGYLDDSAIADLLARQRAVRPSLESILTGAGIMDLESLEREMQLFEDLIESP